MHSALPRTALLISTLLVALHATGQFRRSSATAAAAALGPPPPPYQNPNAMTPLPLPTLTGLLVAEPDSATRRLYARQRVRRVLKVRLNAEGQVRDTVEYQEIDAQGRRTLLLRQGPDWQERRQWSYDAAGHCTSLVIHPTPGRSFTTVHTYNPALGRGRCEIIQANGKRHVVWELQRRQQGDTLQTDAKFQSVSVDRYHSPASGYSRQLRYALHPDTVVTLNSHYSRQGRPVSTQLQYELLRGGLPLETGTVDLRQALRRYRRRGRPGSSAEQVPLARLSELLSTDPACFTPATRFRYDAQQRLAQQELLYNGAYMARTVTFTSLVSVRMRTISTNTYNNLNQLIAQQRRVIGTRYPVPPSYMVFSYQPDGLPAGETSNRAGQGPPVFHRYQYQYYE